ncbi:hypothetical protein T492DRAFT_60380 [Pavlovales sp. CCMP2436]|nr:hypothetical protein T492DRAFT_60380 [Pavlovales sp. CCMP2436]
MRAEAEERSARAVEQLRAALDARDEQLRAAQAELGRVEREREHLSREMRAQVDKALAHVDAEARARVSSDDQHAAVTRTLRDEIARERDAAAGTRAEGADEHRELAAQRDAASARCDELAQRLSEELAASADLRRAADRAHEEAGHAGADASEQVSSAVGVLEGERKAHARQIAALRAELDEREAAAARAALREQAHRKGADESARASRAAGAAEGGALAEGTLNSYALALAEAQAQLETLQAKRANGTRAVLAEVEGLERELANLARRARDERADAAAAAQLAERAANELRRGKAEAERALVQQQGRARKAHVEVDNASGAAIERRELECVRREAAAEESLRQAKRVRTFK